MRVISFSLYYINLRLSVWLGFHRTVNPLSLKWQWQNELRNNSRSLRLWKRKDIATKYCFFQ